MSEKAPINSNLTIGTDAVQVLPDRSSWNTKRKAYILTNTSTGGQKISLSVGAEAEDGKGIVLYPGGSTDRTPESSPSQLAIRGVSDLAGATLAIYEEVEDQ